MKSTSKFEHCIEDQKNRLCVMCQFCNSKILTPKSADHTFLEKKLPNMTQKKDVPVPDEGEDISEFWTVDDMFRFENIGFTHTVNDIKYLSCADCEMGPIGFHIISTKMNYVALSRVKHQDS